MEDRSQWKRALVDALAGAIAGGVSRTVTSPLDVIKIRFQVQLEPVTTRLLPNGAAFGASKYTGMLQATRNILQEEGMRACLSPVSSLLQEAQADGEILAQFMMQGFHWIMATN